MGPLCRYQDLLRSKISPYIMPMNATQPMDVSPTTCSASMTSLLVGVTAIAESAMHFISIALFALELDTTIGGHSNLCIVQCCCLLDLPLDDGKCVHLFTPESLGGLNPFLQSFASQ